MDLYLFNLDLEEEFQRMRESDRNLFKGLLHHTEENILVRVVMILIVIGDHIEIEGPLKEEGTKARMEDHQMEEIVRIEDILEEGIQIKVKDPMDEEDPLIMEDPQMMEDPLMMEGPLEMDDILDTLEDEDHQDPKDPWTCKTSYSTNAPGNIRHNCFGNDI